ncbi:MAG: tripartite tricarboxylate transporter permease, partial [Spirochaetes bacterium]|nr:tripartite tricarboxylate transporter permease [Spirochaetota bacterium]
MVELFVSAFSSILSVKILFLVILGTVVGIIFGAIPGLTATMAVALCLPLTFGMGPIEGMAILLSLYIGGISGGLISAILIKIPGTPSSIATTFDGYPLAERGEAGKALGVGIVYSFLGGMVGFLTLFFIAPPLAEVALRFGPYEYFSIAIFSLTLISSLSGKSMVKGLASGLIGVFFASVGPAPIDTLPRFTYGIHALEGGFNLLPALIGLFAVS